MVEDKGLYVIVRNIPPQNPRGHNLGPIYNEVKPIYRLLAELGIKDTSTIRSSLDEARHGPFEIPENKLHKIENALKTDNIFSLRGPFKDYLMAVNFWGDGIEENY